MVLPKSRQTQEFGRAFVTLPAILGSRSAWYSGDVISFNGLAHVLCGFSEAAASAEVVGQYIGEFEFSCDSGVTGSFGAVAYYDGANRKVVTSPGSNIFVLGTFAKAKESGQTVAKVLINGHEFGRSKLNLLDIATLACAGSAQGDAAPILSKVVNVTGADGTKGVILPTAVAGDVVLVYNSVATNGLKIYPATGADINDGTANAAITIEGKTLALLVAIDATTWASMFTVNT